jgi:hypothetical protein
MRPATAVEQDPELEIRPEPRKQERWWQRISAMWAGIVVAVGVAVWSTAGAWGGLPPHGEDVMSYLVRADFGLPQLVAHGRLDGWFPRYYLGYQEFLFNGPGVVWAMGAARAVTFGALSNTGALKVVGVLAFAALPAAVAFLARSLGLGGWPQGCRASSRSWSRASSTRPPGPVRRRPRLTSARRAALVSRRGVAVSRDTDAVGCSQCR